MDDLFIFDYNEYNVSTFEDGLFVSRAWVDQPGNRDIAVRFLRASMKGWIRGRDFPDEVNSLVFKSDVHQYWMMNEVNKLVFPTFAEGFAVASDLELQASADRALRYGAISLPQNVSSFWRSDLALEAQSSYANRSLASGSSVGPAGGFATWAPNPELGVLGSDDVLGNSYVAPSIHFCFNGAVLAICQGERQQDKNDFLESSSGAAIAMQSLAALSLAIIALVTLLLIVFKDQKNIVAASLPFCLIICAGAAVFISSIFLSVGEPKTAMCNARVWLMGSGFVLMLSSFVIKVRRIDLIFNNRILSALKLTNDTLFLQVFWAILIELILLALFTALAEFKVEHWDDELNAKLFHTGCRMGNQSVGAALVGLLFAFKGLILVLALLLAYRTRNVNSAYNESNHLALSVYNLSFIAVIVVPIVAFMDLRPNNALIVGDVGVLVAVTLSFLLLFVPKLMVAFRGTQAGQPTGQETQLEMTRPGFKKQGTTGGGGGQKLTPGRSGAGDNDSQGGGDFLPHNQQGGGLARSPTHGGGNTMARGGNATTGVGVAGGNRESSQALWVKGLKNLSRDALLNQLRHFRLQESAVRAELKERGLSSAQVDDILASTPDSTSPNGSAPRGSVFFAANGTATPAPTTASTLSTTQVPTPGSQSRAEGVDTVGASLRQNGQAHSLPPAALAGSTPSMPYSRMGPGSFRTSSAEVSIVSPPSTTARPAVAPIATSQQQPPPYHLYPAQSSAAQPMGSPAPNSSDSGSSSGSPAALLLSQPHRSSAPPTPSVPLAAASSTPATPFHSLAPISSAPMSSLPIASGASSPRRIRLHIGDSQLAAAVRHQQLLQQQQQQNQPGAS